ncbi:hypothetical protein R1flu_013762 [Riccia fluitans]|uniref:Stomatal closure-related actin-binding protein 1 n=1 Tax=Riccia fluitans TaxID=41844 RepID=A0ABD1YEH3_9MARC
MPKSGMSAVSGDAAAAPSWAHSPESEVSDEEVVLTKKDEVAREAAELLAQQKRLSVRDLTNKFERAQVAAQVAAAKVEHAHHTRVKETTMLDKEAVFKKLNGLLTDLRSRLGGRNKDDVEEGIKAVETLTVLFTQRESELADERAEVRKMVALFKQASGDAKTMVEEARAVAHNEIEAAKATAAKVEAALHEQEQIWTAADKKELEDLKREAQEARRIKMLHESSKATYIDMEHQIEGLRQQLAEKVGEVMKLRKELESLKGQGQEGMKQQLYQLTGHVHLGTTLSIVTMDDRASDISLCSFQWYRISAYGSYTHLISGAIRPQYAPEPFDVGKFLRAEINLPTGKLEAVQTSGPVDPAPGLKKYVEILVSKGGAQFNVRIVLKNGEIVEKQTLHTLDINKSRIKLHKGCTVKAKENYSTGMQLCGARGGGDAVALGLFWVPKKGMTFMLVLESEIERNAAILLSRTFSKFANIHLGGPDDVFSPGSLVQ